MKNTPEKSNKRGFTLIELLVVIAIIAVLAAAGFGVGIKAKQAAMRLTAQNISSSVALAVNNFYSDYSALPDPATNSADKEFKTTDTDCILLLNILAAAGTDAKVEEQNPKKVRYLDVVEARNKRGGLEYSGTTISGLYDPWGQPFYINLDYDYDERLSFTPQGSSTATVLNGRRVAVYSLGVQNAADARPNTLGKSW